MKYLEAYKDDTGFHYLVELQGPQGQKAEKPFHYGPAPGIIHIVGPPPHGHEPIEESEKEYQKRIEEEIKQTSKQLEDAWKDDPKSNGLTANLRIDLLNKSDE